MDDKNFDRATALEWIRVIEDPNASIREEDIYPLLRSLVSQSSVKTVLDIGCGQGICSVHLGINQIHFVGVDPSLELVLRAEELYSGPARTFMVGNAYDLPFGDKHFDAAVSVAVWHLLSDISRASSEMGRILKNDAPFLIVTADPGQYQTWMERYEDRKIDGLSFIGTNRNPDGTALADTIYLRPLDEITETLNTQGLTVSAIQTIRSFVAISGFKG